MNISNFCELCEVQLSLSASLKCQRPKNKNWYFTDGNPDKQFTVKRVPKTGLAAVVFVQRLTSPSCV